MHVCLCVCVCVYISMYIYVHTYPYMYIYIHIFKCIGINLHDLIILSRTDYNVSHVVNHVSFGISIKALLRNKTLLRLN